MVYRPKSVERPRADARAHKLKAPGVHLDKGLWMGWLIGVHAANQAHFVSMFAQLWKERTDPEPAVSAWLKSPFGFEKLSATA